MPIPREAKVGAFVFAGLVAVGSVVFLIGDERNLFSSTQEYSTSFEDVSGLRRGSPVRMGGVDIGTVSEVAYAKDPKESTIYVTMEIVEDEARRIRKDSRAHIEGKGFLGDMMIVISVGSPEKPHVPAGGTIPSESSGGMNEMVANLGKLTTKVDAVLENVQSTTLALADEQFHEDLKGSVRSLNGILKSVNQGDGYVGRLLRDPEEAQQISRLMANLERSSAELSQTARGLNALVSRVEKGPGFAHEVIYGEGPGEAVAQFGRAADELATTLRGVREGNGIARSVIYGDDETQAIMNNLNEMSGDLRQIVADARAGKGTLGALLVDPSVYEDLKLLLGNVERNKALRALVRYSIQRDGPKPSVEVRDPAPALARDELAGGDGGTQAGASDQTGVGEPADSTSTGRASAE